MSIRKFQITNLKTMETKTVEATGIIEALYVYLPWKILNLKIDYAPDDWKADVVDLSDNDAKYRVKIL